jgi:hypothetical protein
MERLLLLWDELDEIMGYGRHVAVGIHFDLTRHGRTLGRALAGKGEANLGLEEPAL